MLEKGTEGAKRAISPKLEMLKVKVLAETALMVGLSGVLYSIKVFMLPFGLLGVAGFFREKPMFGIVVGTAARFCSHFVSGVLFFASYAWSGWNVYAYSAAYNAGFLIPELAMSLIIMTALMRARVLELYL